MRQHLTTIQTSKQGKHVRRRATISTKDLIDQPVYDSNGDVLGRLAEVVFEVERGMVAYVIVGVDGKRECVLPFGLMSVSTDPPKLQATVQRSVFTRNRDN